MSDERDERPGNGTEEEHEGVDPSVSTGGMAIHVGTGAGEDEEPGVPELPEELPVLPLKNTVLFPFLLSPLLVNSQRSRQMID